MQRTFGPIKSSQPQFDRGQQTYQQNSSLADLAKREGILEERERQISEKQKLVDGKLEQLEKSWQVKFPKKSKKLKMRLG